MPYRYHMDGIIWPLTDSRRFVEPLRTIGTSETGRHSALEERHVWSLSSGPMEPDIARVTRPGAGLEDPNKGGKASPRPYTG